LGNSFILELGNNTELNLQESKCSARQQIATMQMKGTYICGCASQLNVIDDGLRSTNTRREVEKERVDILKLERSGLGSDTEKRWLERKNKPRNGKNRLSFVFDFAFCVVRGDELLIWFCLVNV
jgi:hypothetical protein